MLEKITSANNPFIKETRRLLTSNKARRQATTYAAEGIHLAESILEGDQEITAYICASSALANPEVQELQEKLVGIRGIEVPDTLFESLGSVHASVGIIVLFTRTSLDLQAFLPLKDTTLLLEDIQDPGNIGTILRTAAAVGVKHAILSASCASAWSPKALRAGMGAQFSLNVYEDIRLKEALKGAAIPIAATTLAPDSTSLFDLDLTQPIAWIFGNEGAGVSEDLAGSATYHVLIPQVPSSVESLNVATAAAVCLYEHYRQAGSL